MASNEETPPWKNPKTIWVCEKCHDTDFEECCGGAGMPLKDVIANWKQENEALKAEVERLKEEVGLRKLEIGSLEISLRHEERQVKAKTDIMNAAYARRDEWKQRAEKLAEQMEKIKAKEGFCIFGTSELEDTPEAAFRQGSAYGYSECAVIAHLAIADYRASLEGKMG